MAPEKAVVAEYDRLAAQYDARWSYYIDATCRATTDRLHLAPGERLLDVGCGTGRLLAEIRFRHPHADLCGVDPSTQMLAVARRNLPDAVSLKAGFAEALPFADATFDVAVSNSAFHYFSDPSAALAEMRRVLKPGGRIVVTDWCDDYWACKLCNLWLRVVDKSHTRTFGSEECREFLARAGFATPHVERYKISWQWGLMTGTGLR